MDRVYHKKDTFYNLDQINNTMGLVDGPFIYDRVDIFIDHIHKREGFAVFYYKKMVDGKEVEKQIVPYIETEDDLKDVINNTCAKKMYLHYIELSSAHIYVHADRSEKHHMDIKCVEYINGKAKQNTYRVLKTGYNEILRVVGKYRKNDPRLNRPFDGYTREPVEPPKWFIRQMEKLEERANGCPMPEPEIRFNMIAAVKTLAKDLKNYVLEKTGLDKREVEKEPEHVPEHRRRSR